MQVGSCHTVGGSVAVSSEKKETANKKSQQNISKLITIMKH